jgi:hypothetical protein
MKWEKWDPDIIECLDVKPGHQGGLCENGCSFIFHLKGERVRSEFRS